MRPPRTALFAWLRCRSFACSTAMAAKRLMSAAACRAGGGGWCGAVSCASRLEIGSPTTACAIGVNHNAWQSITENCSKKPLAAFADEGLERNKVVIPVLLARREGVNFLFGWDLDGWLGFFCSFRAVSGRVVFRGGFVRILVGSFGASAIYDHLAAHKGLVV